MIVVDASIMVEALLETPWTALINDRIFGSNESLHVPYLMDIEVTHVLRRHVLSGQITSQQGRTALTALLEIPVHRYAHDPMLDRIWALRDNLSAYDATYVALAEGLDAVLVTRDRRLANAPGIRAEVEVIGQLRGFHEP